MGPFGKIMDLMPGGLGAMARQMDMSAVEKQFKQTEAILSSMTSEERDEPRLLNSSRKRRIAAGSGTSVQQVNQLLRQHKQMGQMMKQIGQGNMSQDLASWLK